MDLKKIKGLFVVAILLLISSRSFANFTYEGILTDPAGTPIAGQTVALTLEILGPGTSTCSLYTESHTAVLTGSDGYFSVVVGSGVPSTSYPYTFAQVFQNTTTTLTGWPSCYTPSAGHGRNMKVTVTVGGQTETLGTLALNPSPASNNSDAVGGVAANNLLKVDSASTSFSTPLTQTQADDFFALINGTSSKYLTSTGALPAVDGSQVTNITPANITGLGSLATKTTSGTADATTFLRGDGAWTAIGASGVTSVAGRTGAVTISTTDLGDFNTASDGRIDSKINSLKSVANGLASLDGSGKVPSSQLPTVSGGVTSVGLSLPSEFSVTASPVTATGTLTGTWANQPANMIFAAPTGASGPPTFRSLANADLPIVDVARGGTGQSSFTANALVMTGATGMGMTTGLTCAIGEVPKWNGTTWACSTDAVGSTPPDSSYSTKGLVQFSVDAATSGINVVSGIANVNTGTGADQIVKLTAAAKYPAVDGSLITNITASNINFGTDANINVSNGLLLNGGAFLKLQSNGGLTTIYLDPGNKVGIGTTSPQSGLDVATSFSVGPSFTGGSPINNMRICSTITPLGGNAGTTSPLTLSFSCNGVTAGAVVNCSPDSDPGPFSWSSFATTSTINIRITNTTSSSPITVSPAQWKCLVAN